MGMPISRTSSIYSLHRDLGRRFNQHKHPSETHFYTLSSLDIPKEYPKPAKRRRLRYRSSVTRLKRFAEHTESEDQEEVEAECFGERKRRRLEEDVTRMFGIGYVPKEAVKHIEPEEGDLEEEELGGI